MIELAGRSSRAERIAFDPIEFPRRYKSPRDVEVSALLAACLAYGRVDLFKPKVESLLAAMGKSPARFVSNLDPPAAKRLLGGFVYRFNVGADLAVLLLGMGRVLREQGSLEELFVSATAASLHERLSAFTGAIRSNAPLGAIRRTLGKERGLNHLLPSPLGAGAAKRLNLFLRWMVRGPDGVDLGVWTRVSPSKLIIPLDTHISRLSLRLGLTRRKDLSWRTAEEITAALRKIDPLDPVRFDFTLCHHGMSGFCPAKPISENCAVCVLRPACRVGRARSSTLTKRPRSSIDAA